MVDLMTPLVERESGEPGQLHQGHRQQDEGAALPPTGHPLLPPAALTPTGHPPAGDGAGAGGAPGQALGTG